MNQLFLTGFMGTGKSAVGPLVAKRLGYRYVDLDPLIEQMAGKPIPKIFASAGEEAFRELESQALTEVAGRDRSVIATGGGAVIREQNRALMAAHGHVVCLSASAEDIHRRTYRGRAKRPLLDQQQEAPLARIQRMLAEREPFYRSCHHIIDTTGRAVKDVADEVVVLHREGAWRR